jgi:NTE family protein
MSKRPKIGLALGGGGARGLAHIGVLKILEKNNIQPDYVCGVSMGSVVAACYCLGLDMEKIEQDAINFNKKKAIKELLDITNPYKSIIKGAKSKQFIKKYIGNAKFKDTKIPFSVIATNLSNGKEKVIKSGNISDALQASISVPGIFPPVEIDGNYYVDGGLVNCTPANIAQNMGADIVIAVDLITKRKIEFTKKPTTVTTLLQAYEIIRSHSTLSNMKKVSKDMVVIKPSLRDTIDSFKFYNINKFIKAGEDATKGQMCVIKRKIKNFGN